MRIAIHAERVFSAHGPKLAQAALRYRGDEVVAVIDSTNAGRTVADVTGDDRMAHMPVVADVEAALEHAPDTLLIGISLLRTSVPDELRRDVLTALASGLDVVSGLHYALGADAEIAKAAAFHGRSVRDLRRPSRDDFEVVPTRRRDGAGWVTLTVGSDASVGKMTTSLELDRSAKARGLSSIVVATGQTGLFLVDRGFPADHLVADFVPSVACEETSSAAHAADLVFVEGQGALTHPLYSNGTLALLHGADPDALILCHRARATEIAGVPGASLPPLADLVAIHEQAATWCSQRAPRVVGIALDTSRLDPASARHEVDRIETASGLPVSDPIRFGAGTLLEAVVAASASN
ncbi:DUF1611 domain-containing protein [Kribbella sp. NPDC051586]|uniref:DUF1611 domain-containing protein n=1 Tax=Kribbella sp. NPDC051586 TaxID=3364118 RepID=UPI0037B91DEF